MTKIFSCKSNEGYSLKILAEILAANLKTGCFLVDERGIFLCMMDQHRKILLDLELLAENFTVYKCKEKKMFIGINMSHFHKMLKTIKKKDSIQLFIDSENSTELGIKVIPKENNRITISHVKIQNIQNIVIDIPTGYTKSIIVSSSEYQKTIKDIGNIGNIMHITSKNFNIIFNCDAGGILKRSVQFGELDDSENDSDEENNETYSETFMTESLSRILKISGLSSTIQIFPGKPILFKTNVGLLGKLSVYIKSKDQLEDENCTINDDYESDD